MYYPLHQYLLQHLILQNNLLCKLPVCFLMKISMTEWFDRRSHLDRFYKIFALHAKCRRIVKESRFTEHGLHPDIAVILHFAHNISCNADLDTVKLRNF